MPPLEPIGDVHITPDGATVYAEVDRDAGQAHVYCSSCPNLRDTVYSNEWNAFLAASYHALRDTDQGHAASGQAIVINPTHASHLWQMLAGTAR